MHSYYDWLSIKDSTQDRLLSWRIISNESCTFSRIHMEGYSHLFFNCSMINSIWSFLKSICDVQWPQTNWSNLIDWFGVNLKGKYLAKTRTANESNSRAARVEFELTRVEIEFELEFKILSSLACELKYIYIYIYFLF